MKEEKVLMDGGELQTLVKVTNKKLGISTYWTWEKFEEKLIQMKELYEVRSYNIICVHAYLIHMLMC